MARHKEFDPDVVLQRAMTLFWQQGYEATSIQNLVDRMGIHKRSMYDTFGDKRSLFIQALDLYISTSEAANLAVVEAGGADARETIRHLLRNSIEPGERPPGCLAVNTATEVIGGDTEVAAKIDRHFEGLRALLIDVISRGQRSGQLSERVSAEDLGTGIHHAWLGLRVEARSGSVDAEHLQKSADSLVAVLG